MDTSTDSLEFSVSDGFVEPMLAESKSRWVSHPIVHSDLHAMYRKAQDCSWTEHEVDMATDTTESDKLTADERLFIEHVLAFFAASDGIVNENLALNFYNEVQLPEARAFYAQQIAIENVHSQTYSLLIVSMVKNADRRNALLNAVETVPGVKAKADWAVRWLAKDKSFAERLVAFAAVEGIFFSGSFAAIFWLKTQGKNLPGLYFSNELIARDEGMHTDFACLLFSKLERPPEEKRIHEILTDAVRCEVKFLTEALPVHMIGMNVGEMCRYIEYVTDRLATQLGCAKIYNTPNPFVWMELMSLEGKSNFFERRVSEYKLAANGLSDKMAFDADF